MDVKELLAKVEAATGPDRELDFAILKALGIIPAEAHWKPYAPDDIGGLFARHNGKWELPSYTAAQADWKKRLDAFIGSPEYYADKNGSWVRNNPAPHEGVDWQNAPVAGGTSPITGSIDAALALVERVKPGWEWRISGPSRSQVGMSVARMFWPQTQAGQHGIGHLGEAATPPLAILAALLTTITKEERNG